MPVYLENWFWNSRAIRCAMKVISVVAPILAFIATMWVIQQTEARFFPVVTGWTLDYIDKHGEKLTMGGKLYKDRPCTLINTVVVGVPYSRLAPRVVIYQVSPNELNGADTPVGYHTWGPWSVTIPQQLVRHRGELSGVEVVGRHRCHPLWVQETRYGFVPIDRVPI